MPGPADAAKGVVSLRHPENRPMTGLMLLPNGDLSPPGPIPICLVRFTLSPRAVPGWM